MGQLAFFAEYLEVTSSFARWVEECPLPYTSPNAPAVVDLLGTWLLSILDGQRDVMPTSPGYEETKWLLRYLAWARLLAMRACVAH
jgi:hypothetical protein